MRRVVKTISVLAGLSLASVSSTAIAGVCGVGSLCQAPVAPMASAPCASVSGNSGPDCSVPVIVGKAPAVSVDPVHVNQYQGMDYLRSVHISQNPRVNITRVHNQRETVSLTDAPSAFTGGCEPGSTSYCRKELSPIIAAPLKPTAPVVAAPIVSAPIVHAPVVSAPHIIAQGAMPNPANRTSRIYGAGQHFVPGIVHAPTSLIDRDPARAQAALNATGKGGQVPHPGLVFHHGDGTDFHMHTGMARHNGVIGHAPVYPMVMPMVQPHVQPRKGLFQRKAKMMRPVPTVVMPTASHCGVPSPMPKANCNPGFANGAYGFSHKGSAF